MWIGSAMRSKLTSWVGLCSFEFVLGARVPNVPRWGRSRLIATKHVFECSSGFTSFMTRFFMAKSHVIWYGNLNSARNSCKRCQILCGKHESRVVPISRRYLGLSYLYFCRTMQIQSISVWTPKIWDGKHICFMIILSAKRADSACWRHHFLL